jgi:nucleoside-diphosphate-sugar epimerase
VIPQGLHLFHISHIAAQAARLSRVALQVRESVIQPTLVASRNNHLAAPAIKFHRKAAADTVVSEDTPTSNHEEPSSRYYQAAEHEVLVGEQGCVLRFPDMYGAPGDLDFEQRVALCHEYFGGKAIFSADAPLYAIHFEDVVDAVVHAFDEDLAGVFNVCDNDNLPATNQVVFDAICDNNGLPRLAFLNQIKAPLKKISAGKIYATGYRVQHQDPNAHLVAGGES